MDSFSYQPFNVIIADDHPLFRSAVFEVIRRIKNFGQAHYASNGLEVLEILRNHPVDIVLLDIRMPGMDGLQCMQSINTFHPHAKVIVITMESPAGFLARFIQLGVSGYICKESIGTEISNAIRTVLKGERYFDQYARKEISALGPRPNENPSACISKFNLSHRELEVFRYIVFGGTNAAIADILILSENTIKNHRTSIYNKTNCHDITDATRFALRYGIVSINEYLYSNPFQKVKN